MVRAAASSRPIAPLWPASTPRLAQPVITSTRRTSPAPRPQFQLEVPEGRVEIPEPITRVGPHAVNIHLDEDTVLKLRVDVIPQSGLKQRIADLERRMEAEAEKRELDDAAGIGAR